MNIKVYDLEVEVGQQDGRAGIFFFGERDTTGYRTSSFIPVAGVRFLIAALTQMLAELK
jgi:hypothetical protein